MDCKHGFRRTKNVVITGNVFKKKQAAVQLKNLDSLTCLT